MSERSSEFDFSQIQENLALRLEKYNTPEVAVTREQLLQDCKEVYFFHRFGNLTKPPRLTALKRHELLVQFHEDDPGFTPDILINTQRNFDQASLVLDSSQENDLTPEERAQILDAIKRQIELDERIREPHDLEVDIFKNSVNLLDETGQKLFIFDDPRDFARFIQETVLNRSEGTDKDKTKSGINNITLSNLALHILSQDFEELPDQTNLLHETEKWKWIEAIYDAENSPQKQPRLDALIYWAAEYEMDLLDNSFPEAAPDQRFWIDNYKVLILGDLSPAIHKVTRILKLHEDELDNMDDSDINKPGLVLTVQMYSRFLTALQSAESN